MNLTLNCPSSEVSNIFLQGMLDRMSMSYHKYGKVSDAYPDKIDAMRSLRLRLSRYEETGNTEFLMDAANFAMIEFMHPSVANAKFEATDSNKSPGRIWHGSTFGKQDPNNKEE